MPNILGKNTHYGLPYAMSAHAFMKIDGRWMYFWQTMINVEKISVVD